MAKPRSGVNQFYLLLGAIALIGAATLAWLVLKPKTVSIPIGAQVEVADTSGFRGYFLGSENAPVEVTEYGDYQCPACRDFEVIQFPTIRRQLIETGMIRWRYRDFPLDNLHAHARIAAHTAACAADQGKYWEVHEQLFARQDEWARQKDATGKLRELAGQVGLNLGDYDRCMETARFAGRIQASHDEAVRVGAPSTPTIVIGGRMYPGSQPSDTIRAAVQRLLPAIPDSSRRTP